MGGADGLISGRVRVSRPGSVIVRLRDGRVVTARWALGGRGFPRGNVLVQGNPDGTFDVVGLRRGPFPSRGPN